MSTNTLIHGDLYHVWWSPFGKPRWTKPCLARFERVSALSGDFLVFTMLRPERRQILATRLEVEELSPLEQLAFQSE